MRLSRSALCLALAGSLATAGAAGAAVRKPAPAPVCNLVTDKAGDGAGLTGNASGLDVLSADIASSASAVTAVIRLSGPPVKPGNANAPEGAAYYFSLRVPGGKTPVFLAASVGLTGTDFSMGTVDASVNGSTYTATPGVVTGTIAGSTIRLSVPRTTFASIADLRPGVKASGLKAEVFFPLEVPFVGGLLEEADTATSTKTYVAGSASCVKP